MFFKTRGQERHASNMRVPLEARVSCARDNRSHGIAIEMLNLMATRPKRRHEPLGKRCLARA